MYYVNFHWDEARAWEQGYIYWAFVSILSDCKVNVTVKHCFCCCCCCLFVCFSFVYLIVYFHLFVCFLWPLCTCITVFGQWDWCWRFWNKKYFFKNLEVMLTVLISTSYCLHCFCLFWLMKVAKQLHCCCCCLFVCLFWLMKVAKQLHCCCCLFVCLPVLPNEGCQTTAIEMLQTNLVNCSLRPPKLCGLTVMEPDSWKMAYSETDLL